MQLNRAPHESIESYITRASLYRGQLLGLDRLPGDGGGFLCGAFARPCPFEPRR